MKLILNQLGATRIYNDVVIISHSPTDTELVITTKRHPWLHASVEKIPANEIVELAVEFPEHDSPESGRLSFSRTTR